MQPRGPRAVIAEGQDQRDAYEAAKQALENMLKSDGMKASMETHEVRAGNQLIDMFRSSY